MNRFGNGDFIERRHGDLRPSESHDGEPCLYFLALVASWDAGIYRSGALVFQRKEVATLYRQELPRSRFKSFRLGW